MTLGKIRPRWWWVLVALTMLGLALVFVAFFEQIPTEGTMLAIDWRQIYNGIVGAELHYRNTVGLRVAPWSLLPVLPLGWLSLRGSWGLVNFLTLLILVVSVPRHRHRLRFVGAVLLLVVSYPTLRLMADGNLEILIIAGVLLILEGSRARQLMPLAAGILLASGKPQETFMLLLALGIYLLVTWPSGSWLRLGGLLMLVVIPLLLIYGEDWTWAMFSIEQRGSIMDSSLWAALTRTGWAGMPFKAALWGLLLAATLGVLWRSDRTLSRQKAGFLMAASLLLAPYSAGNTLLSVLAIGVVPLFQARPRLGVALFALANLPMFFSAEVLYPVLAWYVTGLLLLIWGVLAWWLVTRKAAAPASARDNHALL